MNKIPVGILGATGLVGQTYIERLKNHPWFEVAYVAASPESAGKSYKDAVARRGWKASTEMPYRMRDLTVADARDVAKAVGKCAFVFSAVEMPADEKTGKTAKQVVAEVEESYAEAEIPVVSNNSAHRDTPDVPMLIPEINFDHTEIIHAQRKRFETEKGFIAVKPNCSIQSFLLPVYALICEGWPVYKIVVSTYQAITGAGYPGVPSYDIMGNVIPYIAGEEEKTEDEPRKILGRYNAQTSMIESEPISISAHCCRVTVIDGHLANVEIEFRRREMSLDDIKDCWKAFTSEPQRLNLPSAPEHPIMYLEENNRPQPRLDADREDGMAVFVGRLRDSCVLDIKFTGLSHNRIRGAAGGGILNAELLHKYGYL